MNKNVFCKLTNKYNPDVDSKYKNIINRPSDFVKNTSVWKPITDSIPTIVNTVDDIKIKIDTIDHSITNNKLMEQMTMRAKDKEIVEEQIKITKLKKLSPIIQNTSIIPKDYDDMKSYTINENDKLKHEKEKFNNLLSDLENLLV